jgi:hypothetical protein
LLVVGQKFAGGVPGLGAIPTLAVSP